MTLTRMSRPRRTNSVAIMRERCAVAALVELYENWPPCEVYVMPLIEAMLMTFPGSGAPPISLAAARRGRKANVVKCTLVTLMLYVSFLMSAS